MLTLHAVAVDPSRVTWDVELPAGEDGVLRPLDPRDPGALTRFLSELSPRTQALYDVDAPAQQAAEMCEAIDGYDRLTFVLEDGGGSIVGLFELSFTLPVGDRERFVRYGVELHPGADVRLGVCLADRFQGVGIASGMWPRIVDVVLAFGCVRILLWGGVYASNKKALRFYERVGFQEVGRFVRGDKTECIDMIAATSITTCPDPTYPTRVTLVAEGPFSPSTTSNST